MIASSAVGAAVGVMSQHRKRIEIETKAGGDKSTVNCLYYREPVRWKDWTVRLL
jgi:hypothetical protein